MMNWLKAHLHQVLGLALLASGLLRALLPVRTLRTVGPALWSHTVSVANRPMTLLQCSVLVALGFLALAWPRLRALLTRKRSEL